MNFKKLLNGTIRFALDIAIVLLLLLFILSLLYFLHGSLEVDPTGEQQEKIRLVAMLGMILSGIPGILCICFRRRLRKNQFLRNFVLFILCLTLSACGVAERESYEAESWKTEVAAADGGAEVDVYDQTDIERTAELLNHNLLGMDSVTSVSWVEEMMNTAIRCRAEGIKEPFVPVVSKEHVIPDELVRLMEEALYDPGSLESGNRNSNYFRTLESLGANEYADMELKEIRTAFPEVGTLKERAEDWSAVYGFLQNEMNAPRNIEYMFHMDGNRYLFVYQSGGTDKVRSLCLTEYTDGQFNELMDFPIMDRGRGSRLIKYGNDFYFFHLLFPNIHLDDADGVCIHKFGENAGTDKVQIRYQAKEYIWEEQGATSDFPSLAGYIDVFKEGISAKELGCGEYPSINGGEAEAPDFPKEKLKHPTQKVFQADIANLGIPVFMQKYPFWNVSEGYAVDFYLRDPQTNAVLELDQLNVSDQISVSSYDDFLRLTDLWFKEIDGKTLTFCMYYVADYSFLLNVSLVEGGEVTPIDAWLLLPKKEFVLTEGEKFAPGL